jgi:hypothetical protein
MENEDEERVKIYYPLPGSRLEPRAVPTNQSGVITNPLDQVTAILKYYKYFKYIN